MFVADHCFRIGSEHKICQDYATTKIFNKEGIEIVYGIVADGCSSSKNVDIGARIITLATQSIIENLDVMKMTLEEIHNEIVLELHKYPCMHDLIVNCSMDSTLIFFIATPEDYRVCFFGDGSCYIEDQGHKVVHSVNYGDNAPPYISYSLEPARNEAYLGRYGNTSSNISTWNFDEEGEHPILLESKSTINYKPHHEIRGKSSELNEIAIFSDGISSFRETAGRRFLGPNAMITPYIEFPIRSGVFVLRNFNAQDKQNSKSGIEHIDDLACASLLRRIRWEK